MVSRREAADFPHLCSPAAAHAACQRRRWKHDKRCPPPTRFLPLVASCVHPAPAENGTILIISCKGLTELLQRLHAAADAAGTSMPFGIRFTSADSFIRQLNYHGFSAIQVEKGTFTGEDVKLYHHPLFWLGNTPAEDERVKLKKNVPLTPELEAAAKTYKASVKQRIKALLASGITPSDIKDSSKPEALWEQVDVFVALDVTLHDLELFFRAASHVFELQRWGIGARVDMTPAARAWHAIRAAVLAAGSKVLAAQPAAAAAATAGGEVVASELVSHPLAAPDVKPATAAAAEAPVASTVASVAATTAAPAAIPTTVVGTTVDDAASASAGAAAAVAGSTRGSPSAVASSVSGSKRSRSAYEAGAEHTAGQSGEASSDGVAPPSPPKRPTLMKVPHPLPTSDSW